MVGGEGSLVVVFDKDSDKEVWKSLSANEQEYCPPKPIVASGKQQIVIWDAQELHGLDPKTGKP